MKNLTLLALLAGLLVFTGCGSDDVVAPSASSPADGSQEMPAPAGEGETVFAKQEDPTMNIVELATDARLNTLVAAVQAADLVETLAEGGPFTVFAPTDDAFAKLPAGLVDALLLEENKDKLQQLLQYHVVDGAVKSSDLRFFQRVPTLEGSTIDILKFFRLIKVNDARVELADVLATNGVVHVIDEVLVPAGFTLEEPVEPELNIVQTAQAGGFDTLVAAASAAGLADVLSNGGPFTVFAPSEAAFAALPEGLVAELLLPENLEKLQELLLYHVIDGEVRSEDLRWFQFVKMKSSGYTVVRKSLSGEVFVNRSRVESADILATNGVIHAIDRVLIPYSLYGALASLPEEAPEDHPALQPMPEGAR